MSGDLDPHRRLICAPQPQKVVSDAAVRRQPLQQRAARQGIDEPFDVEGSDVLLGRIVAVAEDQLEMRVRGDGGGAVGTERADVDALVKRVE